MCISLETPPSTVFLVHTSVGGVLDTLSHLYLLSYPLYGQIQYLYGQPPELPI